MKKIFFICILCVATISNAALAQEKQKTFKDWNVYTTELNNKKVCYIASFPSSKQGNYKRRSEPYLMVTRLSKNTHEVSVTSGYPYKASKNVEVNIEGKSFSMVTDDEHAWAPDNTKDKEMISTMKQKNFMVVNGVSQKNTYSKDKYSLNGFTAAYNHMEKLCE